MIPKVIPKKLKETPFNPKIMITKGFLYCNGGGIGIRTLDRLLTYAGFQDRCIQPLCHPTVVEALIIQRRNLRTSSNYVFLSEASFSLASGGVGAASADFLRLRGSFDARATGAFSVAATGDAGAGLLGASVLGRSVLISTCVTGLGRLRGSLLALGSGLASALAASPVWLSLATALSSAAAGLAFLAGLGVASEPAAAASLTRLGALSVVATGLLLPAS